MTNGTAALTLDGAVNSDCPWSGRPVSADSLTTYRGATVGFCNPDCRDKFDMAIASFDRALSERDRNGR